MLKPSIAIPVKILSYPSSLTVTILALTLSASNQVSAFDDDVAINEIDLRATHYLDIQSAQFRPTDLLRWYSSETGWQITGASLSSKLLYIDSDLKLYYPLIDKIAIGLRIENSVSYADKPPPHPSIEFRLKPLVRPIYFSLYGTPSYQKNESDLGLGLAYGDKPDQRFRISIIKHDYYFNQKSIIDDSKYQTHPLTQRIEATYHKSKKWITHFDLKRSRELELITGDGATVFTYDNYSFKFLFDYFYTSERFIGLKLEVYETNKGFSEPTGLRQQSIQSNSISAYWVNSYKPNKELTAGMRMDLFTNNRTETIFAENNFDLKFTTAQVYALYHDEYNDHMAWSYGLYIGDVNETKDFAQNQNPDEEQTSLESKFRVAWQCHTQDKSKVFLAHFSLNVDDLFNDPGDGGALSFQSTF